MGGCISSKSHDDQFPDASRPVIKNARERLSSHIDPFSAAAYTGQPDARSAVKISIPYTAPAERPFGLGVEPGAFLRAAALNDVETLKEHFDVEGYKAMIDRESPSWVTEESDENALMLAASYGRWEAFTTLITEGYDMRRKDSLGRTVTHHAVLSRNFEFLKKLLDWNAPVDEPDKGGVTPFMLCVLTNQYEAAHYMLRNFAIDLFGRDYKDRTAMDIAVERDHVNYQKLLKYYGKGLKS